MTLNLSLLMEDTDCYVDIMQYMSELNLNQNDSIMDLTKALNGLSVTCLSETDCLEKITRNELFSILNKLQKNVHPLSSKIQLIKLVFEVVFGPEITIIKLKNYLRSVGLDYCGIKEQVFRRVFLYIIKCILK